MFYFLSKNLLHFVVLTKVLWRNPFTVGEVFCSHFYHNPHSLDLLQGCNDGLKNEA